MRDRLKLIGNKLEFFAPASKKIDNFTLFLNNSPIWSFNTENANVSFIEAFDELSYSIEVPEALVASFFGRSDAKLVNAEKRFTLESKFTFDESGKKFKIVDLLGRDMFFSKWGFFQTAVSLSSDTRKKIIKSTSDLIKFLESKDYQAIITSGTLLGAVREGKMLPNDDDADIAVIFNVSNPADLNIKSLELESELKKAGYTVFRHSGSHLQIYFFQILDQTDYYIDIFLGFFKDGNYCQPFHMYHPMEQSDIFPASEYILEGVSFPGPKNIDKYFTGLYGPDWETPNSSFNFETPYNVYIKYDAWFGRSMGYYHNYWEQYNNSVAQKKQLEKEKANESSTNDEAANKLFFKTIESTFSKEAPIIDIACGNGDLMTQLRGSMHEVLGLDFSYSALYRANGAIDNSAKFANLANRSDLLDLTHNINKMKKAPNFVIRWTLNTLDNYIRENIYQFLSIWLKKDTACLVSFDYSTGDSIIDSEEKFGKMPEDWVYSLNEFAKEINEANLSGEILYKGERKFKDKIRKFAIVKIVCNN
ncbi:MAG: hypothetical protein LBB07_00665 [Bifidobacteriaceae bacterium]|jgi:hypothetical protein|nr:hypothetical protein [Bifidobacteriaceae bacterium]